MCLDNNYMLYTIIYGCDGDERVIWTYRLSLDERNININEWK